jgi:hypothetical protein
MAHEFGHIINWPDLYDTNGGSEGVGEWSIMGSGNWTGVSLAGDSPAFADAWLKWYQGWITPTEVSGTLNNQAIPRAEDNATAFLLRPNPSGVDWLFGSHSGTGEFFLVENRQYSGYDAALPGCGLLIWHIDESVTSTNSANANESHPLVGLEQADAHNDLQNEVNRGDTGDPYPGNHSNYDFNASTTPNSNLYSGSASNVSVHVDSTSCSSSMQADLTYATAPGTFGKVFPLNGTIGQPISPTLDWGDASGATSYEYCIDASINGACTGSWYSTGSASQYTISLSPATSYEWQVRANNGTGTTYADGGTVWSFTTWNFTLNKFSYLPLIRSAGTAPAAFGKITPANGTGSVPTAPTLDWADAAGAAAYEYCYDATVNGSCTGTWTTTGTTSQVSLSGLPISTAHEWQVRAINGIDTTYADGGALWSFTTMSGTLFQGFEGGVMPPSGWTSTVTIPGYTWGIGTYNPHSGSYFADIFYDETYSGIQDEIIFSPAFFTSGGTVDLYSMGSIYWSDMPYDYCDLQVWVVKGAWDAGSGDDVLLGYAEDDWLVNWTYAQSTFDFTPYVTGGQTIKIAFRYYGYDGAEIGLDDITIQY